MTLAAALCPNCGAEYPAFHSPVGSIETLCDDCGWASDEELPEDAAARDEAGTCLVCGAAPDRPHDALGHLYDDMAEEATWD